MGKKINIHTYLLALIYVNYFVFEFKFWSNINFTWKGAKCCPTFISIFIYNKCKRDCRWCELCTYPTPESRRQNRKELYPWTKEEKKAKTLLMEREIRRVCLRPILSARPPHTKAPTIIPRYTIRPARERHRETGGSITIPAPCPIQTVNQSDR